MPAAGGAVVRSCWKQWLSCCCCCCWMKQRRCWLSVPSWLPPGFRFEVEDQIRLCIPDTVDGPWHTGCMLALFRRTVVISHRCSRKSSSVSRQEAEYLYPPGPTHLTTLGGSTQIHHLEQSISLHNSFSQSPNRTSGSRGRKKASPNLRGQNRICKAIWICLGIPAKDLSWGGGQSCIVVDVLFRFPMPA